MMQQRPSKAQQINKKKQGQSWRAQYCNLLNLRHQHRRRNEELKENDRFGDNLNEEEKTANHTKESRRIRSR